MSGNKIQEKARITLDKNAKRVNPQKLIEITRKILIGIATDKTATTITYGELAEKLNKEKELEGLNIKPKCELLDAVLTTLSKEGVSKKKGMLSVVVVWKNKKEEDRIPGRGFFVLARELDLFQLVKDKGEEARKTRKIQKRDFFKHELKRVRNADWSDVGDES